MLRSNLTNPCTHLVERRHRTGPIRHARGHVTSATILRPWSGRTNGTIPANCITLRRQVTVHPRVSAQVDSIANQNTSPSMTDAFPMTESVVLQHDNWSQLALLPLDVTRLRSNTDSTTRT